MQAAGTGPLPIMERMQSKMGKPNARRATLKAELQKVQREERDYAAMYRNVDTILFLSKEPKNEKNLEME